ncbi:MAG: glycosyltransferase [Polyangiaceae bacterium]
MTSPSASTNGRSPARPLGTTPPRVLFFTTSLGGGGAESHTLRLLNHLDRARYQPSLAVVSRGGAYEPFLRPDVEVMGVGPARVPSSVARHLLCIPALTRIIRANPPDLICSVMDLPNFASYMSTRPIRNRPLHVFCVQTPPTARYAKTAFAPLVRPSLRRLYPRADRVIALSDGVRDELVRESPRLADNTIVIHNACVDERADAARMAPASRGVPASHRPVLVAAGRLIPQKDYDTLLAALVLVRERVDAELWILGEGFERPKIEALIRQLGLSSAVRLLGFQTAVLDFMRRADVFVLSSVYEGFGNVVAEALAVGTPVVSTDCPYGPGEIISSEENGLLVPVRDPAALARAVVRVLTDRELAARLRENGLSRAEAFRAGRIADAYADAFDDVLGA